MTMAMAIYNNNPHNNNPNKDNKSSYNSNLSSNPNNNSTIN